MEILRFMDSAFHSIIESLLIDRYKTTFILLHWYFVFVYLFLFFFFFKDKAFLFYKIPSAFWIKDKVSISKYISHISIFICSIRINLIFLNLFCRLKNIHYEINVIETRRCICCWSKIFQKLNKILNEKFENSDNNCHK